MNFEHLKQKIKRKTLAGLVGSSFLVNPILCTPEMQTLLELSGSNKEIAALALVERSTPYQLDIGNYQFQYQGTHWDQVNDWHSNVRVYAHDSMRPGRYASNPSYNAHIPRLPPNAFSTNLFGLWAPVSPRTGTYFGIQNIECQFGYCNGNGMH